LSTVLELTVLELIELGGGAAAVAAATVSVVACAIAAPEAGA
jgi:hypothetical protein